MHKQFKKFGFFVSNSPDKESDKRVKCLYKNEIVDKSAKRKKSKIRSVQDDPKCSTLDEDRKHRRHTSRDQKRYRQPELSTNTATSKTELYFISPEEIRRHRKKAPKSPERLPELRPETRRKTHDSPDYDSGSVIRKRDDNLTRLVKEPKHKEKTEKDDYEWLTKKEIFKLLNKSECISGGNSNLVKKFFVFNKEHSIEDNFNKQVHIDDKCLRRIYRYKEDNTNAIFMPFKPPVDDPNKKPEHHDKEEKVDVVYTRQSKKHRSKPQDEQKLPPIQLVADNVELPPKKIKNRRSQEVKDEMTNTQSVVFQNEPRKKEDKGEHEMANTIQGEVKKKKVYRKDRERSEVAKAQSDNITSQDDSQTKKKSGREVNSQDEVKKQRKLCGKEQDGSEVTKVQGELQTKKKICDKIEREMGSQDEVKKKKKNRVKEQDGDEVTKVQGDSATCQDEAQLKKKISDNSGREMSSKEEVKKKKKMYVKEQDGHELTKVQGDSTTSQDEARIKKKICHKTEREMSSQDDVKKKKKLRVKEQDGDEVTKVQADSATCQDEAQLKKKISGNSGREISSQDEVEKKKIDYGKEQRNEVRKAQSDNTNSQETAKRPRTNSVTRTNPLRHRNCLVSSTFPVIEISPTNFHNVSLERKKKSKAFKKYYWYDYAEGDFDSKIETFPGFSDSNKMYQDNSDPSAEDTTKTGERRKLKTETHVSTIVINPEPQRNLISPSRAEDNPKKHKKSKLSVHRSKIPVLYNNSKIVEVVASPKSCKTVEAVKEASSKHKETIKERVSKTHKDKDLEAIPSPRTVGGKLHKSKILEVPKQPVKTVAAVKSKVSKPKTQAPVQAKQSFLRKLPANKQKTKISESSSWSKQSSIGRNSVLKKQPVDKRIRNLSLSPPPTYRKKSAEKPVGPQNRNQSPARLSNDGSLWSRSSRRSKIASNSDTKLHQTNKTKVERKCTIFDRTSTKGSLSNSTFGDRSLDSAKSPTSFLLTKSYRDDDQLNRWQKRKLYSDSIRKNLINKNQKLQVMPPQVLEIRYLTVSNEDTQVIVPPKTQPAKEFYEDDLPRPCLEFVNRSKFDELFESPIDKALSDILNENSNFLKKDFSFTHEESSSSDDSDESSASSKNWYDFTIAAEETLSEISCCNKDSDQSKDTGLVVGSQERIVDSCSAPGSEESGYATVKTASFFQRPDIKALLEPPPTGFYGQETQTDTTTSSLELRTVESKSLQTVFACSQKSVQITLSREEIPETINFSDCAVPPEAKGESKEEEAAVKNCVSSVDKVKVKKKRRKFKGLKKLFFLCCFISDSS